MSDKRTDNQNRAIHKYCEMMADELNNTELSVQKVCTLPIRFTKDNFKELIWKPVQVTMFPKIDSTTKLNIKQVNKVYEEIHRIFAEQWGINVEFPSYETLYQERFYEDQPGR